MKMSEAEAFNARWEKPPIITPALWKAIKPLVQLVLARPIRDWQIKEASDVLDDFARRCGQRGSRL